MKQISLLTVVIILAASCTTTKPQGGNSIDDFQGGDTLITQSLFNDKASMISEENIQKILDGNYKMPQQLRVAIVRLEPSSQLRAYYLNRNDEEYLKTQQSYLDSFSQKFK